MLPPKLSKTQMGETTTYSVLGNCNYFHLQQCARENEAKYHDIPLAVLNQFVKMNQLIKIVTFGKQLVI